MIGVGDRVTFPARDRITEGVVTQIGDCRWCELRHRDGDECVSVRVVTACTGAHTWNFPRGDLRPVDERTG